VSPKSDPARSRAALAAWYEPRRNAYPWRVRGGAYGVLVSEVMLQQTQVSRVVPAWERFLDRFPAPAALAAAPVGEVLRAWKGLGYNRRAAALWRAAGVIVAEHGGEVPGEVAALRRLPGVGAYTAAAVAACAFGVPVPAVDTNLRRVVARARLGCGPAGAAPAALAAAAEAWLDRDDPGAWNQAVMDLGREVCRPVPRCAACPLRPDCRGLLPGPDPARPERGTGPAGRPGRRQPPFEGSTRQLRGRIVDALRVAPTASLEALARRWDEPLERVAAAARALAAEGLVSAGPAALAGRAGGRLRLG
jgi:A/G-specific adenine glycosylase